MTVPPLPEPKRVSGRVFVIIFVAFVIVGGIASIVLANRMRPATMAAHAKMMPLAGTVRIHCLAGGADTDVRVQSTCSKSGQLEVSLPERGDGVKSMSYVVLGGAPGEEPVTGQFAPSESSHIAMQTLTPGAHMIVFVYADVPVSISELNAAVKSAPAGDIEHEYKALEKFGNQIMRGDPKNPHEVRTARLEMKILD